MAGVVRVLDLAVNQCDPFEQVERTAEQEHPVSGVRVNGILMSSFQPEELT